MKRSTVLQVLGHNSRCHTVSKPMVSLKIQQRAQVQVKPRQCMVMQLSTHNLNGQHQNAAQTNCVPKKKKERERQPRINQTMPWQNLWPREMKSREFEKMGRRQWRRMTASRLGVPGNGCNSPRGTWSFAAAASLERLSSAWRLTRQACTEYLLLLLR